MNIVFNKKAVLKFLFIVSATFIVILFFSNDAKAANKNLTNNSKTNYSLSKNTSSNKISDKVKSNNETSSTLKKNLSVLNSSNQQVSNITDRGTFRSSERNLTNRNLNNSANFYRQSSNRITASSDPEPINRSNEYANNRGNNNNNSGRRYSHFENREPRNARYGSNQFGNFRDRDGMINRNYGRNRYNQERYINNGRQRYYYRPRRNYNYQNKNINYGYNYYPNQRRYNYNNYSRNYYPYVSNNFYSYYNYPRRTYYSYNNYPRYRRNYNYGTGCGYYGNYYSNYYSYPYYYNLGSCYPYYYAYTSYCPYTNQCRTICYQSCNKTHRYSNGYRGRYNYNYGRYINPGYYYDSVYNI